MASHMDRHFLADKIEEQEEWRSSCINLIASENVSSRHVQAAYVSDFMHRYAEGLPYDRYYRGTRVIDAIEEEANEVFANAFGAEHADVRPISGAIANMAAMRAFSQPGDVVLSLSVPAGAHSSHQKGGVAGGILGLHPVSLAFDAEEFRIDVDASETIIRNARPNLAIIGASLIPFPLDVKKIFEVCREVGCRVIYDAAHVFGLIFSGLFQDPLGEGAEVVTASTHKTFPGPQGGIVLGNNDDWGEVQRSIFPRILSNHHLHHIPSLLMAALEMQEFGEDYSHQIIRNAKALAGHLHEQGLGVAGEERGYTESHQVVVDVGEFGGGLRVAKKLEKANIILNKNLLPWEPMTIKNLKSPRGIRIGVQEMTRFGMEEGEMEVIAKLIGDVVVRGDEPATVKKKVVDFRDGFQKIHYTWSD